jgi:long-chain acyl-CoA synthetase
LQTKLISKEGGLTYRCTRATSKVTEEILAAKISTLDGLFRYACKKNGSKRSLGVREILDEEDETQPNGKIFKKYSLGNYIWKSYDEVDQLATSFSRGLRHLGLQPKEKICIFAETRPEWLMSAMAAVRQNVSSELIGYEMSAAMCRA